MFTSKFYGRKVLRHLRIARLEAQCREFFLRPAAEQCLLEGAVLVSQWWQIYEEKIPSLSHVKSIIDCIVERVTQLVRSCTWQGATPKQIISLINQVLFVEMGFQHSESSLDNNYLIDKVFLFLFSVTLGHCALKK